MSGKGEEARMPSKKFMMVLNTRIYKLLTREAIERGSHIQELLKTEIIPAWIRIHDGTQGTIDPDVLLDLLQRYRLAKEKRRPVTRVRK